MRQVSLKSIRINLIRISQKSAYKLSALTATKITLKSYSFVLFLHAINPEYFIKIPTVHKVLYTDWEFVTSVFKIGKISRFY